MQHVKKVDHEVVTTVKKLGRPKKVKDTSDLKDKIVEKLNESIANNNEGKQRKTKEVAPKVEIGDKERTKLVQFLEAACQCTLFTAGRVACFEHLIKLVGERKLNPNEAQIKRLKEALDLTTLKTFPDIKVD